MAAAHRALRRLTGLVTIGVAAAGGTFAPSADARKPLVKPLQELVVLHTPHTVVSTLRGRPARVRRVGASRPITGVRTVLPVVGRTTRRNGARWLRVKVPGRPNGSTGWIRKRGTSPTRTRWHLVVKTSSRRVHVYRGGRRVRTFAAVVGKPSTPTPHGRFFVEESVRMLAGSSGGPFALALSARSNVLQEFEGGPGQIALHGVENLGGTPGTAVSHGCVRLANRQISWLAARIAPGTPVTIRR